MNAFFGPENPNEGQPISPNTRRCYLSVLVPRPLMPPLNLSIDRPHFILNPTVRGFVVAMVSCSTVGTRFLTGLSFQSLILSRIPYFRAFRMTQRRGSILNNHLRFVCYIIFLGFMFSPFFIKKKTRSYSLSRRTLNHAERETSNNNRLSPSFIHSSLRRDRK